MRFSKVLRRQGFAQRHHPSCAADDERTGAVQKCNVGHRFLKVFSRAICGHFQLHSQRTLEKSPSRSRSLMTDQGRTYCWCRRVTLLVTAGRVAPVGRHPRRRRAVLWWRADQGCMLHVATSGLRWQLFEVRGSEPTGRSLITTKRENPCAKCTPVSKRNTVRS